MRKLYPWLLAILLLSAAPVAAEEQELTVDGPAVRTTHVPLVHVSAVNLEDVQVIVRRLPWRHRTVQPADRTAPVTGTETLHLGDAPPQDDFYGECDVRLPIEQNGVYYYRIESGGHYAEGILSVRGLERSASTR